MINIQKILSDYNIKYWTEGKNVQKGWININCPACDDSSNHGGFDLTVKKTYYNCWRCGHQPLEKIFKLLKIPLFELDNNINQSIINKLNKKENKPFVLPGNKLQPVHKKYLISRNFSPNLLEQNYKILGTDHLDPDYRFRIIIPIIYKKQIISFTSRDYTNKQELRYKSCKKEMEIIYHKTILYNMDNCNSDFIFVTEGIFDCWRVGEDCCSTFGIGYTKQQLNLLSNYEKIFIIFDNEDKAQERAEKLGESLSGIGKKVFTIRPENYKDIAEMPPLEAMLYKKNILNKILK